MQNSTLITVGKKTAFIWLMPLKLIRLCNKIILGEITKITMVKMYKIPQLLLLLKNCIDLVNVTKKRQKMLGEKTVQLP